MARLFKEQNYSVNAFHMNKGEFYSRDINYKKAGAMIIITAYRIFRSTMMNVMFLTES